MEVEDRWKWKRHQSWKWKRHRSGRSIEVEGKWKWKIDGSGREIEAYSVREIKVAAANCKKSVQSCIELM